MIVLLCIKLEGKKLETDLLFTLKEWIYDVLYSRHHTFVSKVSLFLVLPVTLICWIRYWFSLEFYSLAINFIVYRTISQHLKCPLFYLEAPLLFLPICRWILIIIWGPAQMSLLRQSLLQNELPPPPNTLWFFVFHLFHST